MKLSLKPTWLSRATLKNIREIMAIEKRCFNSCDQFHEYQFRYLINRGKGLFLLIHFQKNLVGYVYIHFVSKDKLRIYALAIDPAYQNKGLASRTLKWIEQYAKNKAAYITLEVRQDNNVAINFYRKLGYQPNGIKKHYYADGMDALLMKKICHANKTNF